MDKKKLRQCAEGLIVTQRDWDTSSSLSASAEIP